MFMKDFLQHQWIKTTLMKILNGKEYHPNFVEIWMKLIGINKWKLSVYIYDSIFIYKTKAHGI